MTQVQELTGVALFACAGLGVLAGLVSGILTAMVYASEDFFQRLPFHWMWWPLLGGLVIGLGGLLEPHALGVGYDSISALLNGALQPHAATRLLMVKAVIWSVALGSGTSGGILAPLLIMGGVVGSLFGGLLSPDSTGTWALVGMAAMMGGTMRAPLTAMTFGLELTHDISALLPLAIGCAAAHATTVLLLKRSILTEKVARRGHHIVREYVVDPFEVMRVGEIMAHPVESLHSTCTAGDVVAFFCAPGTTRHKSYPVIDNQSRLIGMVSRTDVLQWTTDAIDPQAHIGDLLGDQDVVLGYEDELVGRLADRMTSTGKGRVPILRRTDRSLVGLVARRDLLRVRANTIRHEQEREALIRFRSFERNVRA